MIDRFGRCAIAQRGGKLVDFGEKPRLVVLFTPHQALREDAGLVGGIPVGVEVGVLVETAKKCLDVDIDRVSALFGWDTQEFSSTGVVNVFEPLAHLFDPWLAKLALSTSDRSSAFDGTGIAQVGGIDLTMLVEKFRDLGRAPLSDLETDYDSGSAQGVEEVSKRVSKGKRIIGSAVTHTINSLSVSGTDGISAMAGGHMLETLWMGRFWSRGVGFLSTGAVSFLCEDFGAFLTASASKRTGVAPSELSLLASALLYS